jgi:transposase
MFVVACPRETQEMVLEAHNRAFAFFGGVPARLIYDTLRIEDLPSKHVNTLPDNILAARQVRA